MRNALTQCVLEWGHLHQHILTLFWLGLIDPLGVVLNQAVSKSKAPQNVTLSSTLVCMQTCHTFLHPCVDAILGFFPSNWLLWYQLAKTLHVQLNGVQRCWSDLETKSPCIECNLCSCFWQFLFAFWVTLWPNIMMLWWKQMSNIYFEWRFHW